MKEVTKQRVRDILDRLPDDCSVDDVLYHLSVVQSVERGRTEAASGKLISHEEVAREMRRRWQSGHEG